MCATPRRWAPARKAASHLAELRKHAYKADAEWKAYMATYLTPEEKTLAQGYEAGQLTSALKHMNEKLLDIVGQVRTGTDTIATASAEIADGNLDLSSRTEQEAGIEQINQAITQMDTVTQQNAALVEQAAAAAASMQDQAGKLEKLVSVFKLTGQQSAAAARPAGHRRTPPPGAGFACG